MAVGKMGSSDNSRGKVLLVAQEIAYAKVLAGNNKRLRDRGIKRLAKWLTHRSKGDCELSDDDFMRLWKGLFYCMWMADKLIIQEELAETISRLIHCFHKAPLALSFIKCFFRTMVDEWFGIDQFRYDKFLMLVRRFLRQTFELCRKYEWDENVTKEVCNHFRATILSDPNEVTKTCPLSLVMHFCDIYLQELSKVGRGKLPAEAVTMFVQPFIQYVSEQEERPMRDKVLEQVFFYLMKQSEAAVECEEKIRAWRKAGCPGNSWKEMAKVEEEEEEEEEEEDKECDNEAESEDQPLDPRAGRVDVELPQLDFDARGIAEALLSHSQSCTRKKQQGILVFLAKKFTEFAEGSYPLKPPEKVFGRPKVTKFRLKNYVQKASLRLHSFEQKELKKGRRRRRKKKHGQKNHEATDELIQTGTTSEDTEGNKPSKESEKNKKKKMKKQTSQTNESEEVDVQETMNGGTKMSTGAGKVAKKKKKNNFVEFDIDANEKNIGSSNVNVQIPKNTKSGKNEERVKVIKKKKMKSVVTDKGEDERLQVPLAKRKPGDVDVDSKLRHLVKRKKEDSPRNMGAVKDINSDLSKRKFKRRSNHNSESPLKGRKGAGGNWEVSDFVGTSSQTVVVRKAKETPGLSPIVVMEKMTVTPVGGKKVNIALNRNSAQGVLDYHMSVKRSPAIPFDASKKPSQGVLKAIPVVNRINPFYRLSKRRLLNIN